MNQEYKIIKRNLLQKCPRLKAQQRKRIFWFLFKLLLVEALIAFLSWKSIHALSAAPYIGAGIGAVALIFLLWKSKLINTRIYGTVTAIQHEMLGVNRYGGVVRHATDMMLKEFTIFVVTAPNGRKRKIKMELFYEKAFKKGDRIILLSGMKYPVDLTPEELLICPFCGNIFPTENEVCIGCGEPALNAKAIEEIKEQKSLQ